MPSRHTLRHNSGGSYGFLLFIVRILLGIEQHFDDTILVSSDIETVGLGVKIHCG